MKPPPFEPGIPISFYLANHPDGVLHLSCRTCFYSMTYPFERIVEELKARGLGDENTGVLAVGPMMQGLCPGCEGRRWVSRPKLP